LWCLPTVAGAASDVGSKSQSVGKGTLWQQERSIRQGAKEEGNEEEEVWHARVLWRGTDVSSCRQRSKRHVVWNAPI